MSDFDDVQEALRAQGLGYQNGKGGVLVLPMEGGFRLVNLNANGLPRGYTEAHISAFRALFPSLKELLVVNAETRRRADYLNERLKNMASVHAESFKEKVPLPKAGAASALDASEISTFYGLVDDVGYVDAKGDKVVVVSVFGSELPVATPTGTTRPDEAMLQFEVREKDLDIKKIKSGDTTLRAALQGVEARNVRLVYYDDNNPIKGETRVKHMSKTLKTLAAWTELMAKEVKVKVIGSVYVHAEDYYGLSTIESSGGRVGVKRFGPEAFPTNKNARRRFYFGATLEAVSGPQGTSFRLAKSSRLVRIMSGVVAKDRLRVKAEASKALSRIAKALELMA